MQALDADNCTVNTHITLLMRILLGACEALDRQGDTTVDRTILLVPALLALLSDAASHPSCWVLLAIRVVVICWWKSFVCV